MFIRSQNKEILIDANTIYLDSSIKNSYRINACSNTAPYFMIGEYSTKEKAMKVLDMIQKQIVFCSESYEIVRPILKSDPFEPYWKKREVVFNMPQDSEVKA